MHDVRSRHAKRVTIKAPFASQEMVVLAPGRSDRHPRPDACACTLIHAPVPRVHTLPNRATGLLAGTAHAPSVVRVATNCMHVAMVGSIPL